MHYHSGNTFQIIGEQQGGKTMKKHLFLIISIQIILFFVPPSIFASEILDAECNSEMYILNQHGLEAAVFRDEYAYECRQYGGSHSYLFNGCKVRFIEKNDSLGLARISVFGIEVLIEPQMLTKDNPEIADLIYLTRSTNFEVPVFATEDENNFLCVDDFDEGKRVEIFSLPKNEIVHVLGTFGGYVLIEHNGTTGYIEYYTYEYHRVEFPLSNSCNNENSVPNFLIPKEEADYTARKLLQDQFGLLSDEIDKMDTRFYYTNYITNFIMSPFEYEYSFYSFREDHDALYHIVIDAETGEVFELWYEENEDSVFQG